MKTKVYLLGRLVVMATAFPLVACDDEEDVSAPSVSEDVSAPSVSEEVTGDYSGTIVMAFAYGALVYDGQTVTLTASGADAVDVSFSDESLGRADIKGVPVTVNNDGGYTLAETADTLYMPTHERTGDTSSMPAFSDELNGYPCLFSGTISEDRSDYTIVFSMPGVMGGTTYTLTPAPSE